MYSSQPILTINLQKIQNNYSLLKKICFATDVGAVVKANAYGLGISHIAPALLEAGCKHFFVANCNEGMQLRLIVGTAAKIYVFHGAFKNEMKDFQQYNLIPVLNHLEQIKMWQEYADFLQTMLPCIIHIDTGMYRLGMTETEILKFNLHHHSKNLNILYIISHLTDAEKHDSIQNKIQLKRFKELSNKFNGCAKSLANSSGIFLGKEYHFHLVRPGAALYGINPTPYLDQSIVQPVVSLFAPIIQINSLLPQSTVGYNGTYLNSSTKVNLTIATVPIGYADGFFRSFSNKGKMFIQGYEAPVIGRVSMDLTIIDVSSIPRSLLYLGQQVEILGENITADKIAKLCDTNAYEILASLGARYKKIYRVV